MLTLNSDGQAFSQAFIDAVTGPSPSYTARLFSGGSEVQCDIMRLSLWLGDAGEGLGGDAGFQLGMVSSARMTATLLGCAASLERAELEVRIGVDTGSGHEYATVALVTVVKSRVSGDRTAIEAVGRIDAVLAQEQLGLPSGMVQADELAEAIAEASDVDVELGAFASTAQPVRVESWATCADALADLAAALGGLACESGEGVVVSPLPSAATFAPDAGSMTLLPQLAEEDFVIDGLVVAVPATILNEDGTLPDDTLYTFGTGRIQVTDRYATAESAARLWGNIQGATWRPGTLTLATLDPRVTPLDVASASLDGSTVLVPCHGISATFDGGWFGTMAAVGPSGLENVESGPLAARVEESALAAARATANATRAFDKAQLASRYAAEAKDAADDAADAAAEADRKAQAAGTAAAEARGQAQSAQQSAARANAYSTAALGQLGVVQDVIGVLDWASSHGTFARTSDTAIVDGKVYFTYDSSTGDYTPVVEPQASQLANYYELSMSEAMDDFILAHLAVTSRGLWVLPSGMGNASDEQHAPGYKLLLSNGGTYIYDGNGELVRSDTAAGTDFASAFDWHVGGEDAYIAYDASEGTVTIGGGNVVLGSSKKLSDLIGEGELRGYEVEVTATAPDITAGSPTVTLTATVRKDGTALTAAEVLRIGCVKWYRADTGALVGTGMSCTVSARARYTARLEG